MSEELSGRKSFHKLNNMSIIHSFSLWVYSLGTAYHLIDFLQGPTLKFRKEEVNPRSCDNARRKPDVAVSWAPIERTRIDEVGRGKGNEPCAQEPDGGSEAKSETSEALRGNLPTNQPRVRSDHSLVKISSASEGYDDSSPLRYNRTCTGKKGRR